MMHDNYYYIGFIFLSVLIELSKSYKIMTLEDPSLCSPIVKRRIKLGVDFHSGLIVTLNSLKSHTLDWEKNFFCKFQVEVTKNNGIFAVIQNLSFRRNIDTNECIDYLHLKRGDGSISKKYCGNTTALSDMDSKYLTGDSMQFKPNNSFDDHTGQLDVNIHISKEALRFDETRELKIVFTSYRPCTHAISDDVDCGDKYYHSCIYKGYIKDGYVNCPYVDCVDEGGCSVKVVLDDEKKSVGNKVIISTVSVLFIAFVIFICFIWLCRKYQKLCWSEQFSNSNNNNSRSPRPGAVIEMIEPNIPDREAATAMSPETPEEDKDLPPSYESLFPNR